MARTGLYRGYVIDNSMVNPVQVWVPFFVPAPFLGNAKTFGDNLLNNIGKNELNQLRQLCASKENYFLMTMELSAGANLNVHYYEAYGKSTTNSFLTKARFPDLKNGVNLESTGSSISKNVPAYINPLSNPSSLDVGCDAILDTTQGIKTECYENAPQGNWTKLAVGTRVIVSYIDEGAYGVILRQFPYQEEHAKLLLQSSTK